jgi:hypothetical protein
MTLSQVFDVLSRGSFSHLETPHRAVYGARPLKVNFPADEGVEPVCIEVAKDGLSLHFNTPTAASKG